MNPLISNASELHGVMLYFDNFEVVHHLTDEEAGKLFKNIADYACGIEPTDLGGALMSLFCMFKTQIDRNRNKYEELCNRNREKAKLRWSKSKSDPPNAETDNTSASQGMPQHTEVCLTNHNNNSNSNISNDVVNTSIITNATDGIIEDELSFDRLWNIYGKKEGNETELRGLWNGLSYEDKKRVIEFVPKYVKATPEIRYRKYLSNFLKQRIWESYPINSCTNGSNYSNNYTNEARRTNDKLDKFAIMQQFLTEGKSSPE